MFCDFLETFRKNTTKLENSSNRYGFGKYYRNDLVVGTVSHSIIVFEFDNFWTNLIITFGI